MTKLSLLLALSAGFTGGLLSRYAIPERVFAQASPPKEAAPKEIRAQGFILLDGAGRTAGAFAVEKKDGKPNILLFDDQGNVIWAARPESVIVPLTRK